jgi:hypothetical protein
MLIMEEVEKIVLDKLFEILHEFVNVAPAELHFDKENTYLYIPIFFISLSNITSFMGYKVMISPYRNKIILSNLYNHYVIEKNI